MITAGVVVLVVSVLFALTAPALGRRLPPAPATRALVMGSIAVAAATGFVCCVAAFTLLGQLAPVAHLGRWSAQAVHDASPVPVAAAVAGGLLAVPAAAHALLVLTRRLLAVVRVELACGGGTGGPADRLVVIDSDQVDAFATPGWTGRIVITTGLLRALPLAERRAVLEHERSHLRHRHAWWLLAVDLAAAANPMLRASARTAAHAVERWADEDAAEALADRRLVARAVGRAALLRHAAATATTATAGLSALGGQVPDRVRALLEPPPGRRLRYLAVLGVLLTLVAGGSALVQERGRELFVHAAVELHHP